MRSTTVAVAVIVTLGLGLTALILRTDSGSSEAVEPEPAGTLDDARGPQGARLLSDDELQVEMTIYETGVPPHFRAYPYDAALRPIPPGEVELVVDLHRLGGRVDRIGFTPEADYLRGTAVVDEPHSFDVTVLATRAGKPHTWKYAQIEGKVQLGPDQVTSAGIVIATAGPRTMRTTIALPGEVTANATRVARVVPRLRGVVAEAFKQAGDRVRRGELMAIVSSRELAAVKSGYLSAAHQVAFARVAAEREEALWRKKISAGRDFLEATHVLEEALLKQRLAAQELQVLGVPVEAIAALGAAPVDSLARHEVRAPIDGTVTERTVTVGESVAADSPIFTVTDLSTVWVELSVPAKDLGAVRQGQKGVVVSTDLGIEATGRIDFIGQLVGAETRAATARLTLANGAGSWRPGLFVTVTLVREETTVPIAVSADAIQTFRDWQVVFVKFGDWFEARPLALGRSDGPWVEVLSGLAAGDHYAAANSFAVKAEIGKLGATHDH